MQCNVSIGLLSNVVHGQVQKKLTITYNKGFPNNNRIGACSRIVHQTYFGENCEERILGYEEIKQKSKYERCVR